MIHFDNKCTGKLGLTPRDYQRSNNHLVPECIANNYIQLQKNLQLQFQLIG